LGWVGGEVESGFCVVVLWCLSVWVDGDREMETSAEHLNSFTGWPVLHHIRRDVADGMCVIEKR